MWGLNKDNIWAVGRSGTILKYDGSAWVSQLQSSGDYLFGIHGIDANNIWAVGYLGKIFKFDGNNWISMNSNTTATLRSVWAANEKNIWAVGETGVLLKYDGVSWAVQNPGVKLNDLYGVWGTDANNVWVVGTQGIIYKYDGTNWKKQNLPLSGKYYAIHGSQSDIWTVGDGSTILYSKISSVSVTETKNYMSVAMYPNPANDYVQFCFDQENSDVAEITLYDLLGKQIMTKATILNNGKSNVNIDLAGLQKGVYLTTISLDRNKWKGKLVVN
ncbi:MAG: T9SS type A sorting domain-containing protein [Saprospiraceae bacterium]|nr:T9SS type A sorting domain-containing protein [Candidatus Vicinibacter affinis]